MGSSIHVEITRLRQALEEIDAIVVGKRAGALVKVQRVARAALGGIEWRSPVTKFSDDPNHPGSSPEKDRRYILSGGQCVTCSQHMASEMMPPHDASPRCESGKRNHCSCDVCF